MAILTDFRNRRYTNDWIELKSGQEVLSMDKKYIGVIKSVLVDSMTISWNHHPSLQYYGENIYNTKPNNTNLYVKITRPVIIIEG